MDAPGSGLPRVLITGFEPFPGAPVNPTQALVRRLMAQPLVLDGASSFQAALLPVDYASIGPRLSEIGKDFSPDIAIHFGLAHGCNGFRLERMARNAFEAAKVDNCGFAPIDGPICVAEKLLSPTLPLPTIADALEAQQLPFEWSDDAGGYLCNTAMTLSLAGACKGFAPIMSGFVHIPMVGEGLILTMPRLMRGVAIIAATAVKSWPDARLDLRQ